MAITESNRHELHQALITALGKQEAATLMEHLPPVGWADVATRTDLDHLATVLGTHMDARISGLETKIEAELNSQLRWIIATMLSSFALIAAFVGMAR